jgi:hypothetical protein
MRRFTSRTFSSILPGLAAQSRVRWSRSIASGACEYAPNLYLFGSLYFFSISVTVILACSAFLVISSDGEEL